MPYSLFPKSRKKKNVKDIYTYNYKLILIFTYRDFCSILQEETISEPFYSLPFLPCKMSWGRLLLEGGALLMEDLEDIVVEDRRGSLRYTWLWDSEGKVFFSMPLL